MDKASEEIVLVVMGAMKEERPPSLGAAVSPSMLADLYDYMRRERGQD